MREATHLRRRYRAILSYVGLLAGLTGVTMLVPLLAMLAWPIAGAPGVAFLVPGLTLAGTGFTVWRHLGHRETVFTLQEGGVVVVTSWLVACAAGAIPFVMIEHCSPSQAIFESISGWTTTGLSILDVTRAHPAILLWRSTMQLVGGAGLAILMLASISGPGGLAFSSAEGRPDQLVPNVRASATLVVRIYSGYVVVGVLALRMAGMTWWDAVNHAFCALSTGGFSTHPDSVGHWNSALIEFVLIVLMVLGNLNFLTAWLLLRGRLDAVKRNGEIRLMALVIPIAALVLLLAAAVPLYGWSPKALRVALFESISALTTTGYSTVSYGGWSALPVLTMITLMLVGSGACSTGGAIKQHRIYLLYRSLLKDLRAPFEPKGLVRDDTLWLGEQRVEVSERQIRTIGTFLFLYLATWLAGAAILAAHGVSLADALFEFASALGTVGLSVGVTTPSSAAPILWVESAGMLLGRLEFLVIFVGVTKLARDVWRMGRRQARPPEAAGDRTRASPLEPQ